MKRALALSAAALLMIGTPALAQGGGARGERGQPGGMG